MPFPRVAILSPGHPTPSKAGSDIPFSQPQPPCTSQTHPEVSSPHCPSALPHRAGILLLHHKALHFMSLMWSQQFFYSPDKSLLLHNSPILLSAADFNFNISKLLCRVPTLGSHHWRKDFGIPGPLFSELCVYSPFIQSSPCLLICLNSPFRFEQLKEHSPPVQPNQLLRSISHQKFTSRKFLPHLRDQINLLWTVFQCFVHHCPLQFLQGLFFNNQPIPLSFLI